MKIILDNNIWISFLIGKRLQLLERVFKNSYITVYVCEELIREFCDVANRPKIRRYISENDILETIKIMEAFCVYAKIIRRAVSGIRDEKDLYLLSLADSVKADYIITGDKDLLVIKSYKNTKIMTYNEFLAISF